MNRPQIHMLTLVSLVIGLLLLPALPWATAILGAFPKPMNYYRPPYPSIPSLAPYHVYLEIWQDPGSIIIATGVTWLGVLMITWGLFWPRWPVVLAVSMVCGLLLLCWTGWSIIDISTYLKHPGGARINGQQYELVEIKYPSGPLYQLLYVCNSSGWGCEQMLQDSMASLIKGSTEERIRSLLDPPRPLTPDS